MAAVQKTQQLVVITPNEVGTLEQICKAIQDAGTGITHICASTLGQDARFMMAVHDAGKARPALEALEFEVSLTEVLEVELDNVVGSLEPVAALLRQANVDIDFLYGTSADGEKAKCILSTNDNDRAVEVITWA